MPVDIRPVIAALTSELRAEQQRLTKQIRLMQKLSARVNGWQLAMKQGGRRKRRWSKAARAAVSRRMRAYWANRRKVKSDGKKGGKKTT